jgi:pimeloyl-ACP methyl ester carboxylesterase
MLGRGDSRLRSIRVPTLVVWGDRDAALDVRLLDGLEQLVPGVRVEILHGVSHFVQNDAPDEVNRLLLEFLSAPAGAPRPAG